jgi:hypothetical protein
MKVTKRQLRNIIKETITSIDGEKVNPGELGFRDAMDGNPEKIDAQLTALGYDHPDDVRAYEDGFEQGIHEKGFYQ